MTTSAASRPVVVTICGGSASGKSTLANALAARLHDYRPVVLEQDWYFRDFAEYDPAERERVKTANHPDAVLWPAFHHDLDTLIAGQPIREPAPGTRRHELEPPRDLGPSRLLIVAGLFTLWDQRCREVADLRLFTDVDEDERVLRRISRDVNDKARPLDDVMAWYRRDVRPNYPTYTAAFRSSADLVVPTERGVDNAVHVIGHALRGMLGAATSGCDPKPPS